MGAYRILFLDRVPDSAACNEAVKLVSYMAYIHLVDLLMVYCAIYPEKEELLSLTVDMPIQERLAFQYSYPLWLADKWINDYGIEKKQRL